MTDPLTGADMAERLDSVQWPTGFDQYHSTGLAPREITYSFQTGRPSDLHSTSWTDVSGWGSYTEAEKEAVRDALDHYASLLNVTFTETLTENAVDLTFLRASQGVSGGRGRFQYNTYPELEYDGFILFNTNRDMSADYNFNLILHEIGHAFSLKHPGNYDVNPVNAPPGPYLPEDEDNYQYTLMSYSANPSLGQEPDTLMLYDIGALQERWGANMSTATGDDSYAMRADGNLYVIWDADGEDGITAAGGGAAAIDLRPGAFSQFTFAGRLDERIAVAYGAEIENATGSDANDVLRGNALDNMLTGGAGDDMLTGDEGDDTIDGGAGTDRAVYDIASSEATFGGEAGGEITVATAAFGTDTLRDVEFLVFTDGSLAVADLDLTPPPGDVIDGDGGDNLLAGDSLGDTISGLNGDDTIDGGGGGDLLRGGKGQDEIDGGEGDDEIRGQRDADLLSGGAGNDNIKGGGGNDTLSGGEGDDFLKGGSRKDLVEGDAGNDKLFGNSFDDTLIGGAGDDTLKSGGENDLLIGGEGDDVLKSGLGEDILVFDVGCGNDRVLDFDVPRDTIQLTSALVAGRSLADLIATAEVQEDGVLLDFGNGDSFFAVGLICNCGWMTAFEII